MSHAARIDSSRPSSTRSKTGRVWEVADMLTRRFGRRADRKSVIEAYAAEGGNVGTGATQYACARQPAS